MALALMAVASLLLALCLEWRHFSGRLGTLEAHLDGQRTRILDLEKALTSLGKLTAQVNEGNSEVSALQGQVSVSGHLLCMMDHDGSGTGRLCGIPLVSTWRS